MSLPPKVRREIRKTPFGEPFDSRATQTAIDAALAVPLPAFNANDHIDLIDETNTTLKDFVSFVESYNPTQAYNKNELLVDGPDEYLIAETLVPGDFNAAIRDRAKLRRLRAGTLKARDLGVTPNLGTDQSDAVMAAINEAVSRRRPLEFDEAGTILAYLPITTSHSGLKIFSRPDMLLTHKASLTPNVQNTFFVIHADSGNPNQFIEDLEFHDLTLRGRVDTDLFYEFSYLASINGVRGFQMYHPKFIGFQGDGIYFGSGIIAGQERHNEGVWIYDGQWDGINKDNRNGLSIIDCVDGHFIRPRMRNLSRANMPGAIDIEPDGHNWHRINNLHFRDVKVENSDAHAWVCTLSTGNSTTPLKPYGNISLRGLDAKDCSSGVQVDQFAIGGVSAANKPSGQILIENVNVQRMRHRSTPATVNPAYGYAPSVGGGANGNPLYLDATNGVTVRDVYAEDSDYSAILGYTAARVQENLIMENVIFNKCGSILAAATPNAVPSLNVNGVWIGSPFSNSKLQIKAVDCGRSDGTAGRGFAFQTSDAATNTEFDFEVRNEGRTTIALASSAGYTLDPHTSRIKLKAPGANLNSDLGVAGLRTRNGTIETLRFYANAVTANVSNQNLLLSGGAGPLANKFVAHRPGVLCLMMAKTSAARTAGQMTVSVRLNGSIRSALNCVIDATNTQRKSTAIGETLTSLQFAEGDEIDLVVTTNAAWAPVGDVVGILEISF